MHTTTESLADNLRRLPLARPVAEVDPHAVVASTADCVLTYGELDRWSNRLARLLLGIGADADSRVAIAISDEIESVVAERAIVKLGATPVPAAAETFLGGTAFGVTVKARRGELSDAISWLVLDDRSTLQRYLAGSDAPLTELEQLPRSA
ncbi:AMP-binding enzyme [Nocardia tenerifensis]|uniref:AMP-binding enzyme n=1 Tax=Nocardia tenerifensis TaxID=228006 RepID=A0A318KE51_9NOCA|nr:AMP-binding protein [Nocardia tenerifensis]PXX64261.1 AMP-binding enzyme [Nocardia tenerifensis]